MKCQLQEANAEGPIGGQPFAVPCQLDHDVIEAYDRGSASPDCCLFQWRMWAEIEDSTHYVVDA